MYRKKKEFYIIFSHVASRAFNDFGDILIRTICFNKYTELFCVVVSHRKSHFKNNPVYTNVFINFSKILPFIPSEFTVMGFGKYFSPSRNLCTLKFTIWIRFTQTWTLKVKKREKHTAEKRETHSRKERNTQQKIYGV